jgi:hypothetical protein
MKPLALWPLLLVTFVTVPIWTLLTGGPAGAEEGICLPPSIPPISALQPVATRTALFSQEGQSGRVAPIRIQQVRYVDRESREYVFSWYRIPITPAEASDSTKESAQPILLGVDDDPDGPTPAWYDSGAATSSGHVRAVPQQACVWQRFHRSGELQS